MLRSLWSGVSGMQAHQIALDVESNNIANVNTVGFKYSRASFVDMLSQIKLIATSPYKNGLGGQNDFSIGLGVGIDATTKVFSQGNTQNTDVKTDIAIE
ncbi:flagellar hook-basal body complex protein, partial [uncultured Helicobacter sp.]